MFLGGGKTLFCDSPKIIEAIIRLARWSRPEPILRIDADVEVNDDAVEELIAFHEAQQQAIGLHPVYFFSGGYQIHDRESETQEWLLNDFAARVQHICSPSGAAYKKEAESFLRDLAEVGVDPFDQAISGAGLCMSYDAISMLPPFANVGDLIVWIDDHLKRRLHEALGHIVINGDSRCPHANFKQVRYEPPVARTIQPETLERDRRDYLPRLVRGVILDALIVERPLKPGKLARPGRLASLIGTFLDYRERPTIDDLRQHLEGPANTRLKELCDLWETAAYSCYGPREIAAQLRSAYGKALVREVIKDANSYFELLARWRDFAEVVVDAPADQRNDWLFRNPVC